MTRARSGLPSLPPLEAQVGDWLGSARITVRTRSFCKARLTYTGTAAILSM